MTPRNTARPRSTNIENPPTGASRGGLLCTAAVIGKGTLATGAAGWTGSGAFIAGATAGAGMTATGAILAGTTVSRVTVRVRETRANAAPPVHPARVAMDPAQPVRTVAVPAQPVRGAVAVAWAPEQPLRWSRWASGETGAVRRPPARMKL